LGRVAPEKGAHLAIEVARRLGRRLVIAAKVDRADRQYFHERVEPLIDGELVQFVGEADADEKRRLYAGASCLLLPLCWEEPFGLVMTEAMACGTPVIAFARGSASELVVDGETGFLVHDVEGMMRAVHRIDRIDPRRCRRHVEENFSAQRMADGYLAVYERILEESAVGEALAAVAPGRERSRLLARASQLAEAASSRPEEGPADEELAVA
jgi:glycosyltransferase involved in cell wall biosynthesis